MSLADAFVLVKTARHRSICHAASFGSLLFELNTGVDFGPFVRTGDTHLAQLTNRNWLRAFALQSWFRASGEPLCDVSAWFDRPNESLGGISPFEATANDDAFDRAYALAFLTGGGQVEPGTPEASLLEEFCSDQVALLASTNRYDSLISAVFWALHECTGSLVAARLMLTCAPVSGEKSVTLYRLVRECDAETINEILRTQFGYAGEGLDH